MAKVIAARKGSAPFPLTPSPLPLNSDQGLSLEFKPQFERWRSRIVASGMDAATERIRQ
jgi:hypothetical protein